VILEFEISSPFVGKPCLFKSRHHKRFVWGWFAIAYSPGDSRTRALNLSHGITEVRSDRVLRELGAESYAQGRIDQRNVDTGHDHTCCDHRSYKPAAFAQWVTEYGNPLACIDAAMWEAFLEDDIVERSGVAAMKGLSQYDQGRDASPQARAARAAARKPPAEHLATLGTHEECWCGQPMGHDWDGKATGTNHPREFKRYHMNGDADA